MTKRLSIALVAATGLTFSFGAFAQTPLEGDWAGQIDASAMGGPKLRIAVHVHTKDGKTETTMDSPDQNQTGIPVTISVEGKHVHLVPVGAVAANSFDGEVDGTNLKGTWAGAPTSLTRAAK